MKRTMILWFWFSVVWVLAAGPAPAWAQGSPVQAVGNNSYGQLGIGYDTWSAQPALIGNVVQVAGGGYHTLALKADGTVWTWGWNVYGQLGDGTTTQRLTPVQVSDVTGVTAIAGGSYHSLALKGDGTVWAWGWNNHGQLGDGTTTSRSTPVQVSGLTGVTAIAGGGYHSLALKGDGTVWAWGYNAYGQLGDGTTTQRLTPVQVSGLEGATAIAGGYRRSLALKGDGTVWAWGSNYYGQLGDGTTTQRLTPVQVSDVTNATAIAAGVYHSLFLSPGPGQDPAPSVLGVWPTDGSAEYGVQRIVVAFSKIVLNVTPEDLSLSTGTVTDVAGSGAGPYVFSVSGLLCEPVTATVGGNITDEFSQALTPYTFSFVSFAQHVPDINDDGQVTVADDLPLFIEVLLGTDTTPLHVSRSDMNCDGVVNALDIQPFVAALIGG